MSVLLLGSAFLQGNGRIQSVSIDIFSNPSSCSVESRKCFNCLNADYSGPTTGLLSLNKCGDFDPENGDIVKECLQSDRCFIATLDETL